jgi:tRNA(fMet)-specific endonuclease VapC
MRILLDTNVFTAFQRGDETIGQLVRSADQIVFSTIVAGELLHGYYNGSRPEKNIEVLMAFLDMPDVEFQPVTLVTSDRFGRVATALRKKGRPIPTNDMWIAAHALETGADLISFDSHFEHVDGLAWIRPESH